MKIFKEHGLIPYLRVYFDGERDDFVQALDTVEGWIDTYEVKNGHVVSSPDQTRGVVIRKYGKVEVRLEPPQETNECSYAIQVVDTSAVPIIINEVSYPAFPKNNCTHPNRLQEGCVLVEGKLEHCHWGRVVAIREDMKPICNELYCTSAECKKCVVYTWFDEDPYRNPFDIFYRIYCRATSKIFDSPRYIEGMKNRKWRKWWAARDKLNVATVSFFYEKSLALDNHQKKELKNLEEKIVKNIPKVFKAMKNLKGYQHGDFFKLMKNNI